MKTITANFNVILSVFVAAAFIAAPALATQWYTVYETDFSSDPGWVTNDPSNQYWDPAWEAYHHKMWDAGNQYAYIEVPFLAGRSYKLGFDIFVTQCDWGGNLRFGLGDGDMDTYSPVTWWVGYHNVDQGSTAYLTYSDDQGGSGCHSGQPAPFVLSEWYHNTAIYDAQSGTLSLTVTRVSDGSLVGTPLLSGVGGFAGINRLYMSSIGDDYAPGRTGEGYIDNVQLSTVPEPGTLLLLAPGLLGIAGVLPRRRR